MKPNCYNCIYRGNVAGDAHSCCRHPWLGKKDSNPFMAMIEGMQGKFNDGIAKLGIKADEYGVKSGWVIFPANFDPIWILACKGYTQKDKP